MGANLWRSWGKKKLAAAVVQLDGSVLIWHMIEWFLTARLFICGTFKNKNRAYG
jgi:hypothetical protein